MAPLDPVTTPRPEPLATPASSESASIVLAFYQRLRRLPLGLWADAARPAAALPGVARAAQLPGKHARAQLREVMNARPRTVARHRRRVQHAVAVAEGIVDGPAAMRMKKVTLAAALALTARPLLPEDVFARLYAPFAELIPLRDLSSPPRATTLGLGAHGADDEAGAMC
jgi:hypothetical protein